MYYLTESDPTKVQLDKGFTAAEVANLSGVSYRQLDYWARTGWLTPAVPSTGSGNEPRRYTVRQLEIACFTEPLIGQGFSPKLALHVAEHVIVHGSWHIGIGQVAS